MAGYEDASSTKLLATACAACSRPLRDAVSVEAGMGPDCREKHGYGEAQGEPDWAVALYLLSPHMAALDVPAWGPGDSQRDACNVLVHRFAALPEPKDPTLTHAIADAVTALGFATLGAKLKERCPEPEITLTLSGPRYEVKAPLHVDFVARLRLIPGRRWDKEREVNVIPGSAKKALYAALRACFPGKVASGPKGFFRIP